MSESESDDCSQSAEEWLAEELFEYCKSDNITEEGIREIIESHKESTPDNNHHVSDYDFFRAALSNEKVTEGIIQCLLEYFPAAANYPDDDSRLPLHYACGNNNVSLRIIRLLIDAAPDSVRREDNKGYLPLHYLCPNPSQGETTLIAILRLLLEKYPDSVRHECNRGHLPIHTAATASKSPEFCRVLIDAYPGSERIPAISTGLLPFHHACSNNSVAIVEYLYNRYPDAIDHASPGGIYPIHAAISRAISFERHDDKNEALNIVKFLLGCDPNVKFQEVMQGETLLHYACQCNYGEDTMVAQGIIEAIYDAHPEFIRMEDNEGKLPLHKICTNTGLDDTTGLEILKLLLEKHPESVQYAVNGDHLPIHIALIASKSPEFCRVLIDAYPGSERIAGSMGMLPLHFACMRNTVKTVEYLYECYANAINETTPFGAYPIHLAIAGAMATTANPKPGAAVDIVKFLLLCDPDVKFQEVQSQSLLAYAVSLEYEANSADALEIIEVICDANPELIRKEDDEGKLPLHLLCGKSSQVETTAMAILSLLLKKHPESVRHVGNDGHLPIHFAAMFKSPEFCRVLIEAYPGSERLSVQMGVLPIFCACMKNSVDTVEYLYNLYPDSINQLAGGSLYPIHAAIRSVIDREANPEAAVDVVKFLLDCDPRVKFQKAGGFAPNLSFICHLDFNDTNIGAAMEITKAVYDADPEAIGDDDIAEDLHNSHSQFQVFIHNQLYYFNLAEDEHAMTTPDEYGQPPLHTALQNNARLGSIKLLVKGNPLALRTPGNNGALPLHVACMCHESTSVIQYLVELDTTKLEAVDEVNDTPLHYACDGARYETIALLLDKYGAISVSKRNVLERLPIDVLWESDEVVDRESMEYTECVFRLLRAYPETVMNCV